MDSGNHPRKKKPNTKSSKLNPIKAQQKLIMSWLASVVRSFLPIQNHMKKINLDYVTAHFIQECVKMVRNKQKQEIGSTPKRKTRLSTT